MRECAGKVTSVKLASLAADSCLLCYDHKTYALTPPLYPHQLLVHTCACREGDIIQVGIAGAWTHADAAAHASWGTAHPHGHGQWRKANQPVVDLSHPDAPKGSEPGAVSSLRTLLHDGCASYMG